MNLKIKKINYSWVILFLCGLGIFFSGPGQTYFTSVFIESYVAEFGWSRSFVSGMYSAATLSAGLLMSFVGRLADKFGPKKMIIAVAIGLGIASMWTSFAVAAWMIFIGFFLARLMGQGSMTLLPSIVLPNWFVKKRATAFSLMALGGVAGQTLLPGLNAFLIAQTDWRFTWRIWAVLLWVLFVPLIAFFMYNKPQEVNMLPDGKRNLEFNDALDQKNIHLQDDLDDKNDWSLKDAMKTRAFWQMMYVQILTPMISTGVTFHFISVFTTKGLSEMQVPFLLSVIAITSLPSTLLSGFILNKIKANHGAAIIALLISSALLILLFTKSFAAGIVFAVIQGLVLGFQGVWGGVVWPNYFGVKNLGSIRGVVTTSGIIASALGPIPFGIAFDKTGSHKVAIIICLILAAIGIFIGISATKPKKLGAYNESTSKI